MKCHWKFAAIAVFCVMTPAVYADLTGYWTFDDVPGSDSAVDVSGNENHGVVMGDATFVAAGKFGGAIDLGEGENEAWVQIPSAADGAFNSIVDTQSATVAFWMNRGGPSTNQWTFGFDGGDTGSDAVTGRQLSAHAPWGNGIVYLDTGGCCGSTQRINTDLPESAISGGEWVHMAFVRDVDDTRIYLDGELLLASEPDAITSPVSPITRAGIGAAGDGTSSQLGLLDDFAVWDSALSPGSIAALADGSVTPLTVPEPSSIALFGWAACGLLGLRRRR